MNKDRRKQLAELAEELDTIHTRIEELQGDEQDYFDNMPESFQMSEKGEMAEAAIESLNEAMEATLEAMNALEEAQA